MDIQQVILWIFGTLIGILVVVFGYLSGRVKAVEKDLSDLRADIPVRYANEGDIQRVEKALEAVRTDFNSAAHELRLSMADMSGKLNQLIGQNTHRG
jgi:hypothetical protein